MARPKIILDRKEYDKKYYITNKEKLMSNAKIKVKCDKCGLLYSKSCKYNHLKSKIHNTYVANNVKYANSFNHKVLEYVI